MLHCMGLIVKTPDRFIGISVSDCEINAKLYNTFTSLLLFNVTRVSSHKTRHFLSIVEGSIIKTIRVSSTTNPSIRINRFLLIHNKIYIVNVIIGALLIAEYLTSI